MNSPYDRAAASLHWTLTGLFQLGVWRECSVDIDRRTSHNAVTDYNSSTVFFFLNFPFIDSQHEKGG